MIKIVSVTLEDAYKEAASALECSVTELNIEVIQSPSSGFLGMFKKSAIIVAAKKTKDTQKTETTKEKVESKKESIQDQKIKEEPKRASKKPKQHVLNDTIMPESFVSTQDDEDYDMADINFTADYDEDEEVEDETIFASVKASDVAKQIEDEINELFSSTCFEIDKIEVSAYDDDTILVEFKGEDAALLIGKEGYRYKALSYMIFNWINTKYQLQLRLEIAEFLKNQEEAVNRYLVGVCENIDRDGRAQTKILDGVLVQIALKELREKYPDKYVAIRSTRDGLKFIIINDYHN